MNVVRYPAKCLDLIIQTEVSLQDVVARCQETYITNEAVDDVKATYNNTVIGTILVILAFTNKNA